VLRFKLLLRVSPPSMELHRESEKKAGVMWRLTKFVNRFTENRII
jgi:hypothetical protein